MKTTMTMTCKQLKEKYDFKFMYEVSGEIDNRLALLVLGGRFNADNVDLYTDNVYNNTITARATDKYFRTFRSSSFYYWLWR